MSNKDFIKQLSQKIANYNTPEQAISQANSCDSLSNDIYTDSKRFIYELLQNADDASSQTGNLDFRIDFSGQYIVVSHKGEPFSENDIKSICSVGDGNKKSDENKTGFKGIGFKSVFAHSEFVIIKSGEYCFKFDKQESNKWNTSWGKESKWKKERQADNKDDEIKMPWQIIPVWAEIPNELKHLSIFNSGYNVSTFIRHHDIEKLKKSLTELFSESQIILFLRSKEIKITINTTETLILEKSVIDNATVLKRNNKTISEWLIKTEQFDIPQDIQILIKDNNRYPRKLRESKRTEISFAIQLEKGKLKAADDEKRLIFTYLPTSINSGLPFLLNANFLTDAGRQNIHIDLDWNQWLYKQIPLKYFAWIAELAAKEKYNDQFLNVVPQKLSGYNELENSFNEGYREAIKTIAFIPNLKGKLLKVSEVLFDETNISDFINKETLFKYIDSTRNKSFCISSLIPHLHPITILKKMGIETFEIKDLDGFFISNIFLSEHKLSENFNLIKFLYQQVQKSRNDENRTEWNMRLKNIPFVFDKNEKLQKPEHIYFPSVEYSNHFSDDISIVHSDVFDCINKNQGVKSWLKSLGIEEPTDVNFIKKTIIGNKDFVKKSNAISIGRYLFNAHKKGLLENCYKDLGNFKLLTKRENLINANDTFLSDFYEPNLKIEFAHEEDWYVSELYFEKKDLISEWKTFFLKIGVSDDIVWKESKLWYDIDERPDTEYFPNREERNEIARKYTNKAPSGTYPFIIHYYCIHNFSFILKAIDFRFSHSFWKRCFEKEYIIIDDYYYGNTGEAPGYGPRGEKKVNMKENYFIWTIQNIKLFPTIQKDCRKASEIFKNNIPQIKEIAGKYLPVLDYDGIISPKWSEILPFKTQLELDDYLEILACVWQDTDVSDEEQKENKKRVCLIYEKLTELLPDLHPLDKDKLQNWVNDNNLLAKDGNFYSPKELSLVTVDGFNANNLIYTEKKDDDRIIELFRLWDVHIIDKVTPKFSNNTVKKDDLRERLKYIAQLIALVAVEKSKSKKDWEDEYNRINKKLSEISFYETTKIYISYGNEQDEQERSTWADGNTFYYVGNWYKPRILDGLVEPLCKFLNIRYAERILTVLLLDDFEEGLEYLKEKGFDISLISEIKPPIPEPNPDRNSKFNPSDEDLGRKGEIFVFEELKRFYKEKYNQSIIETGVGFKVGNNVEVIWQNKSENTTANHDFKVIEKGKEIYIDSKATPYNKNVDKVALYISGNELDLMERAEKYLIARVFNVTSNPQMELIKMRKSNLD
jgi:hypothetical protein